MLLALFGVALILAGFRVDVPMLSGGSPATVARLGARDRVPVDHRDRCAGAVDDGSRGTAAIAGWRPIAVVSVAASALFVVFLFLPWGNASFLVAILTVFAWITAVAVRLATCTS